MTEVWRQVSFATKGFWNFQRSGFLSAQKKFDPEDLNVDISKKVYLVTGANSGLGYETSLAIAQKGGIVHMVCRNPKYGEEAVEKIKTETKNENIHLQICDVSLQKDIRQFVKKFLKENQQLNCIVNNAGVLLNKKEMTSEKIDKTIATNTIGTFLLTELLIPLLEKSGNDSRVISVSSGGMYTQKLDDDYEFKKYDKKWDGALAYGMTKRHQVVLTDFWAKKYVNTGIQFSCMHPGWADTKGVQTSLPTFRETLKNSLRSAAEGADTIVWLAISNNKKMRSENGKFYFDRSSTSPHLTWGGTEETTEEQQKFYDDLVKMTSWSIEKESIQEEKKKEEEE
eukprot:gene1271-11358_t